MWPPRFHMPPPLQIIHLTTLAAVAWIQRQGSPTPRICSYAQRSGSFQDPLARDGVDMTVLVAIQYWILSLLDAACATAMAWSKVYCRGGARSRHRRKPCLDFVHRVRPSSRAPEELHCRGTSNTQSTCAVCTLRAAYESQQVRSGRTAAREHMQELCLSAHRNSHVRAYKPSKRCRLSRAAPGAWEAGVCAGK